MIRIFVLPDIVFRMLISSALGGSSILSMTRNVGVILRKAHAALNLSSIEAASSTVGRSSTDRSLFRSPVLLIHAICSNPTSPRMIVSFISLMILAATAVLPTPPLAQTETTECCSRSILISLISFSRPISSFSSCAGIVVSATVVAPLYGKDLTDSSFMARA